jgi:hypothetical protein
MVAQVGYSVAGRSRGRVAHVARTWRLGVRVSLLSLKTKVVEGFPVWASKSAALVW